MITDSQLNHRIVPKIRRVRALGKEVYVNWCGAEHTVQVASEMDGIIINAGSVRIKINARFIVDELGKNATLDMVERCFYVRQKPQTIADYD